MTFRPTDIAAEDAGQVHLKMWLTTLRKSKVECIFPNTLDRTSALEEFTRAYGAAKKVVKKDPLLNALKGAVPRAVRDFESNRDAAAIQPNDGSVSVEDQFNLIWDHVAAWNHLKRWFGDPT